MNLHNLMSERALTGEPVRVGVIGAGRFGTMYLAQARNLVGVVVVAVADLNTARTYDSLRRVDWPEERVVTSVEDALSTGSLAVVDNAEELFVDGIDVIVEATGNPIAGIQHALRAFDGGQHVVMVTVEADALAGPAMAARAQQAGVIYTLAYGDQPAMICELVDWARTSGFEVVCAGKGARYLPEYHGMNPGNVWEFWDFPQELIDSGQLSPRMHTSFRDGTKAAIEMASVANACGLRPSDKGLTFTPSDLHELSSVCRPREAGGVLDHEGTVDVVSSVRRDGSPIEFDLQEGIFVTVKATNDYVSRCFTEYPWHADASGTYATLYRPYHYVGLELNVSIAAATVRAEATGSPRGFYGDVVATAKKPLSAGEILDGEGGYAVWGQLVSADASVALGALPIAMAHNVALRRDVAFGEIVRWDDVIIDESLGQALEVRRETEKLVSRR